MQRIPRIAGLVGLLAAVAASSSCNLLAVFDPCPESAGIEDVGQMDETWELQTVNRIGLPYLTSKVSQNERVTRLKLSFETNATEPVGDSCSELIESSGNAYAEMTVSSTAGNKVEFGTATFRREHILNIATIDAEEGSVALRRPTLTSNSMTISSSELNLLLDQEYFGPNLELAFIRTVRPGQ